MPQNPFTLSLHMVSSLDGKIAKADNSISWFEASCHYEAGLPAEDPETFLAQIDCYVMGSKTYELALELSKEYGWPYGDKPTVVLSSRKLFSDRQNIQFYNGNLHKLVEEHLKPNYRRVWVVGGSLLCKELLNLKLLDEIRVSILPIILGEGLPFFKEIGMEHKLELRSSNAYQNGMLDCCYTLVK